jgi:transposase-like protein
MKNKYVKRSKISEAKFRKIIMYFALELDSQKIAVLTSLNRNTVNRYLSRIRSGIAELCEDQASKYSYCTTAKKGRQTAAQDSLSQTAVPDGLPVFGIQSRNAHIYTELLPNGVHLKLRRLISNSPGSDPLLLPRAWRHYDGIVDLNGRWHYRLNKDSAQIQAVSEPIGSIEDFLGFARKRLITINLNGADHFNLLLKECEYRFNNRNENLYQLLLKRFREKPLS